MQVFSILEANQALKQAKYINYKLSILYENDEQDILVLRGVGAREVLEEWADGFGKRNAESIMTILSISLQEKDADLEMQESLDHSA